MTELRIRLTTDGRIKTGLSRSEFHFLLLPFIKRHYTVISVKYIIKLQRAVSALPLLLHKVDSAVKNAIKFDVITATNCPGFFCSCWFQCSWWSWPVYFTLPASFQSCYWYLLRIRWRRLPPSVSEKVRWSFKQSSEFHCSNGERLKETSSRKEQDPRLNYKKDISVQETERRSEGELLENHLREMVRELVLHIFTWASRVDLGTVPPSRFLVVCHDPSHGLIKPSGSDGWAAALN